MSTHENGEDESSAERMYARKGQYIKLITNRVEKPAILYAREIWGERATN